MDGLCLTPLGNLVSIVMGQAPPGAASNFDGLGTPFVKAGEFGESRPVIREWTTRPLRFAKRGDVLVCVVGATCGKINLGEDCAIGRSVAAIRPDPERLDQFYLHYFLMTLVEHLRAGSMGAAQTVISKEMIQVLPLPWVPLPEQRRIVAILDEAFEAIATAKVNAESIQRKAREVFKCALSVFLGRGVGPGHDPGSDRLMDGWRTTNLGDVLALLRNGLNCQQDKSGKGHRISRIESISSATFDVSRVGYADIGEKERQKFRLLRGDILFSHINSPIHVGKTALFDLDEEVYHGVNLLLMRPTPSVCSPYLEFFLKYLFEHGYWLSVCKQSVNQASVNQQDIWPVRISYPIDISEQRRIVARLNDLVTERDRTLMLQSRKLTVLNELKKSLLRQAFTGQLTAKSTDQQLETVA